MKHLKTYEVSFSYEPDYHELYIDREIEKLNHFTGLMDAAFEGKLKKFKYYLNNYIDRLNNKDDRGFTTLMYVVVGKSRLETKMKMIKMLIDNGADVNIKTNDQTFYDRITSSKLKTWVDEQFPQYEFKLKTDVKNYNL